MRRAAWTTVALAALLAAAGAAEGKTRDKEAPGQEKKAPASSEPAAPAPLPTQEAASPAPAIVANLQAAPPAPAPAPEAAPAPAPVAVGPVVAPSAPAEEGAPRPVPEAPAPSPQPRSAPPVPLLSEGETRAARLLPVPGTEDAPRPDGVAAALVAPQTRSILPQALSAAGILVAGAVLAQRLARVVARPRAEEPLPDDAPALLRLGQRRVASGDLDAALAAFRRAAEISPGLAVARLCEGVCLLGLRRVEEAREALLAAHRAQPDDPLARFHLARACALTGRSAEALAALSPLAAIDPAVADAALADAAFAGLRDHPALLAMSGRL